MEQFMDIVRQINELSGVLLDALEQSVGGRKQEGGAPGGPPPGGEGAPGPEGTPPAPPER